MVAALASAVPSLAGCPSARPVQGVERVGTARTSSSTACRGSSVDVWAPPGFCVTRFAEGLSRPRHLVVAPNGDVLVATRAGVVVLWDADGDGKADEHEHAIIGRPDLSQHGVALSPDGRFLYLADSRAVRRFPWHQGMRSASSAGAGEVVIPDVPLTVDHPYRTITFDAQGRLYLAVGAEDNLTPGNGSVIRRYTVPEPLPSGGLRFDSGERFAWGIRNAEALAWDRGGHLWAFVNGRDFLRPAGTPETFYLDHPGDWIFRLADRPETFYGFPNCWVLGPSPWGDRRDPASQWADPDANEGHDDAFCQDAARVHPAAGALPAHTAPLGAVLYTGTAFPARWRDTFFVTSHGSWNRHGEQRGRTILNVRVDGEHVTAVEPFLGARASDGNLKEGDWSERPVGVAQGPRGELYFTSDETGDVLRVAYAGE